MPLRRRSAVLLAPLLFALLALPGATLAPGQGPGQQSPIPAPVPRGDRVLAVDVNEAENGGWDAAFAIALSTGMQATSLSVAWDDIEVAPGVYDPNPNWLAIANLVYPLTGTRVGLTIATVDTNVSRMPADLAGLPFDDPVVISRFQGLLDWAFTQIPDLALTSLSIGNEVDIYLGTDASAWGQYQGFFAAAAAHARTLRPGLVVGAKATYGGLMGYAAGELATLNAASDAVLVTYYPLHADFTVRPPTVVRGDVDRLVAAYSGRTLHLCEAGYPTSAVCASSETMQAAFVRELFRAWDEHADSLALVEFTWLHDLSQAAVDDLAAYYGISDPRFLEFLRTLGLRTHPGAGADKKGLEALGQQARARGW